MSPSTMYSTSGSLWTDRGADTASLRARNTCDIRTANGRSIVRAAAFAPSWAPAGSMVTRTRRKPEVPRFAKRPGKRSWSRNATSSGLLLERRSAARQVFHDAKRMVEGDRLIEATAGSPSGDNTNHSRSRRNQQSSSDCGNLDTKDNLVRGSSRAAEEGSL